MKQKDRIYMISDAARQVQVEAHVLRYWEEELQLPSKRNEMGHRYYTEEDLMQLVKIKELKEQGLQLKAIRNMIKKGVLFNQSDFLEKRGTQEDVHEDSTRELGKRQVVMVKKGEFLSVPEESREQKSIRLQQLLRDMITDALQRNNQKLCQDIKESILKEMDYQFRLQEEREDVREEERVERQEAHYKQLDELLRSHNSKKKFVKNLLRKK